MQQERDYLVKKIFPGIRALCRERGVVFTEIDLRWGLTEEEAAHGRIVRACLEEIDRCRPHFIGILGSRYGWVPEYHEIAMDPELHARYPWVEDAALNGESILEIEFVQAVIRDECRYAFFYRRQEERSEETPQLDRLVERLNECGGVALFETPEELGERVRTDLTRVIHEVWEGSEQSGAAAIEERRHHAFAGSRRRAYIPIPEYRRRFEEWMTSDEHPLVISGGSGMGKSALVAWLIESWRAKNRDAFVIEHYVGATGTSTDHHVLIRRVVTAIHKRYGVEEELPESSEELEEYFPAWLGRVGAVDRFEGDRLLLVIDALDQFGDRSRRLDWLPERMPSGVRLVVSTRPGHILENLRRREWSELPIRPLETRAREAIVVRYLGEFHKALPTPIIRRIGEDPKSASPLFLRTLAEEMRLHGSHEDLDTRLAHYLDAPDLDALFQHVIERMEEDYGRAVVRPVLSSLGVSRAGLSESDIIGVAGVSRADLSILLYALDYHLLRNNGRLDFFHGYLKRAVEARYLADQKWRRTMSGSLISWFGEGLDLSTGSELEGLDRERLLELLHALSTNGERDRLVDILCRPTTFLALFDGESEYEVLHYWGSLNEEERVTDLCAETLRGAQQEGLVAGRRCDLTIMIVRLLRSLGLWSAAEATAAEGVRLAEESGEYEQAAEALQSHGELLLLRGAYREARGVFEKRRDLAEEKGDDLGVALADGEIGAVELEEGRPEEARGRFETMVRLCRERGDRVGTAQGLAKIGEIEAGRGRYDEALGGYEEALELVRTLGDRRRMAAINGQIGLIAWNRKEYDRAMERYEREAELYELLGDRHGSSMARCKVGLVHLDRDDLDAAESCFRDYLEVTTELGYARGVGFAQGDLGIIHLRRGDYDRAAERFDEALATHRRLGFPFGVALWLKWKAEGITKRAEVEKIPDDLRAEALAWAEESEQIASRIGNHELVEEVVGIIARLRR